MPKQTPIQRRINNKYGTRRSMNGAGSGGRLVARREKNSNGRVMGVQAGKSQLGNRSQRYNDIRVALGLTPK